MCTEVWARYEQCEHYVYQNTFKCKAAEGRPPGTNPWHGQPRGKTTILPEPRPTELRDPMCDREKPSKRKATRPVGGFCAACKKSGLADGSGWIRKSGDGLRGLFGTWLTMKKRMAIPRIKNRKMTFRQTRQ